MQNKLSLELQKNNGLRRDYLEHILRVKTEMMAIRNQRQYLESSDIFIKALDLTKMYLPEYNLKSKINIHVSFVIFGNDARGYTPIVIDLLFSIGEEESLRRLIAHEAHHYLRNHDLNFSFPKTNDPDFNLIWICNQLQSEGIADLIDKRVLYFDGGLKENTKWAIKYRDYYSNSDTVIKELDHLFKRYYDESSSKMEISEMIRNTVPMSGHPTGYYMAKIILEELGIERLNKNINNPFYFIRSFNEAVSKVDKDVSKFSSESILLLNKLESKYSIH
jgi:hypothetical protein